jgi:hypothetical protein
MEQSDINEHLPVLRDYAKLCKRVTEFGLGHSTIALATGFPNSLTTYDIARNKCADYGALINDAGVSFEFVVADTLKVDIGPTDLLFIDTLHTYEQLTCELTRHGDKVSRFIIMHDTTTYGEHGEVGGYGLNKAIGEFLCNHHNWDVREVRDNNNGLVVLEKIS